MSTLRHHNDLLLLTLALTLGFALHFLMPGGLSAFISSDGDTAYHLLIGKIVWESHAIPHFDPTLLPWDRIDTYFHSWLAQILMFAGGRILGLEAVAVALALCAAASLLIFAYSVFQQGASWRYSAVSSLLIFFFMRSQLLARPHLLSWLLLVILIATLKRDPHLQSKKSLAAILCIMILWSNIHASFVLGLALIGVLSAGLMLNCVMKFSRFLTINAVALFASVLNPYGIAVHYHVFHLIVASSVPFRSMDEHQLWEIGSAQGVALLATTLVILILMTAKRASFSWHNVLPILFGLVLANYGARHTVPGLMIAFSFFLPALGKEARRSEDCSIRKDVILPLTLYVLLILTGVKSGIAPAQFDQKLLPIHVADLLQSHSSPATQPLRIYSEAHWGGYLSYRLFPQALVFINGAIEHYGSKTFLTFLAAQQGQQSAIDALLDEHKITRFVILPNGRLAHRLKDSPRCKTDFIGEHAALFSCS